MTMSQASIEVLGCIKKQLFYFNWFLISPMLSVVVEKFGKDLGAVYSVGIESRFGI
jgi:hypothetical protein